MSEWYVEYSPSGAATCKGGCKGKIGKGEVRWAKVVEIPDRGTSKQCFHMQCLKYPPRAGMEWEQVKGLSSLTKEEQEACHQAFLAAKEAATNKKKSPAAEKKKKKEVQVLDDSSDDEVKPVTKSKKKESKKGKKRAAESDDEDGKAKKKRIKKKSGVEVELAVRKSKHDETGAAVDDDPVAQKYGKLKISDLKEYLRLNKQVLGGKKEELVARCVDGEKHGRLMPCPVCAEGKLNINERGNAACSGFFDEDVNMRISCSYEVSLDKAPRGTWLIPGESEGDESASGANDQGAGKKKSGKTVSEDDLDKVMTAFKALPEDARPKEVSQMLMKIARQMGLKLPEDDMSAMQKVGSLLMKHKTDQGMFDIKSTYKELRQECGTLEEAKEEKKKQDEAGPKAVVPENSKIASILFDLGKLESKAQDGPNFRFKAQALIKAAMAIRTATYKVESGKQVSSGKTKLPGVGGKTGGIIDEIIKTGQCARLEELRERFSSS